MPPSEGTAAPTQESYEASVLEKVLARDPDDTLGDEAAQSPADPAPSPAPAAAPDPTVDAAPPTSSTTPTPQAQGEQASPQSPAPSTPVPTPSPTPEPFRFSVDGREVGIPGVTREADGAVRISADAWPKVLPYLRDHQAVTQQIQAARAEAKHWHTEAQRRTTKGDALWDRLTALVDDPAKLAQFFENYQQQVPILKAEAEKMELAARLDQQNARDQAAQEEAATAQLSQDLRHGTTAWAQYYTKLPEFEGLSPERVDKLLWDMRFDLWFQSAEGIPQWNVAPGGYAVNHHLIRERLTDLASDHREKQQAIKAAEKAARENAAALAPSNAPPAVSTKGSPGTDRAAQRPTSREEYEAKMERLAREI